jgi:hypothetical protein
MRERWKAGTKGFSTDESESYQISRVGNIDPRPDEIEKLASRIVGAVNAVEFDWPKHTAWLSEFSDAKNAIKRLDATRQALDERYKRALAYMKDKGAVLGEACAHVGIGSFQTDVLTAEREWEVIMRALVAKLGEEIRP